MEFLEINAGAAYKRTVASQIMIIWEVINKAVAEGKVSAPISSFNMDELDDSVKEKFEGLGYEFRESWSGANQLDVRWKK